MTKDHLRWMVDIDLIIVSVENEERIIRSCGWLPNTESMKDRECFTRTGTHQVNIYKNQTLIGQLQLMTISQTEIVLLS